MHKFLTHCVLILLLMTRHNVQAAELAAAPVQQPQTIATLSLAALDTLDTLGVPVQGLVQQYALDYLQKYQNDSYQNIGTFFEPDVEAIAALNPDLIVIGPRSAKFKKQLSGITEVFDSSVWGGGFFQQFHEQTLALARLVNKEAEAINKLTAIQQKVSRVKSIAPERGKALVLVVRGGKVYAFNTASRLGWVYQDLAIPSAIDNTESSDHGQLVSFEWILSVHPDWLFILDRDAGLGQAAAARTLMQNAVIAQTPAAQKNQMVYLDPYAWNVGYGLTAVDISISQILDAYLNSELNP
ncbi:siderophore ABC transporter substrate-binding protein [Reinekea marinisedimentorum]|uniref:Iron complex transport system substrate-binding protein n=1 Tax=Reinekea marinisedimentorum TaxID=230495 RepID=A0A4R3HZY0_9GAMM|nr:ABC transporter substrate-binding protein [Reinekea marinisedimentorum]TCS37089.1 iron complex transport system substrate-binding protein [Reinekea marinisedimentorum]